MLHALTCPSGVRQVLSALDAKLDGVITTAAGVAGAPAAFLSGNNADKHAAGGSELDHVVAAKNAYLRAIEDAVQLVKVRPLLHPLSGAIPALARAHFTHLLTCFVPMLQVDGSTEQAKARRCPVQNLPPAHHRTCSYKSNNTPLHVLW